MTAGRSGALPGSLAALVAEGDVARVPAVALRSPPPPAAAAARAARASERASPEMQAPCMDDARAGRGREDPATIGEGARSRLGAGLSGGRGLVLYWFTRCWRRGAEKSGWGGLGLGGGGI